MQYVIAFLEGVITFLSTLRAAEREACARR